SPCSRVAPGRPSPGAPAETRPYLSVDAANPDSLVSCVRRAREAAQRVRESISSEMWEQINTLHLSLGKLRVDRADRNAYAFYRSVREGAQFFQGLAATTMAHDE